MTAPSTAPSTASLAPALRCAPAALARAEPVYATASTVSRWLLVEQPTPWGPSSFPETSLGPDLTAAVQLQAAALGARPLLVRRPTGGPAGNAPARRVWVVDSRPGAERVLTRLVTDDATLAALPLRGGWEQAAGPLFLVCAHGRHDTCCAVEGRPLARALSVVAPEETWKVSHIGGDRFAPNVLVLPHGLYYSRVPLTGVGALVAATRAGQVVPDWLRGRSTSSVPAQAAQHHARAALGLLGVGDLPAVREDQLDRETWRVTLAAGSEREAVVVVRRLLSEQSYRLTCHALVEHPVPRFELVSLAVDGPPA